MLQREAAACDSCACGRCHSRECEQSSDGVLGWASLGRYVVWMLRAACVCAAVCIWGPLRGASDIHTEEPMVFGTWRQQRQQQQTWSLPRPVTSGRNTTAPPRVLWAVCCVLGLSVGLRRRCGWLLLLLVLVLLYLPGRSGAVSCGGTVHPRPEMRAEWNTRAPLHPLASQWTVHWHVRDVGEA